MSCDEDDSKVVSLIEFKGRTLKAVAPPPTSLVYAAIDPKCLMFSYRVTSISISLMDGAYVQVIVQICHQGEVQSAMQPIVLTCDVETSKRFRVGQLIPVLAPMMDP